MDPTNISKIKSYLMITQKKTSFGIGPMWGVLFLSLILSSFQMIILPSSDVDKRGWDSAHLAFSCKEILKVTSDDNSELAGICKDWGRLVSGEVRVGKWGHGEDQRRLYWYPVFRNSKYHLKVQLQNVDDLQKMECDDRHGQNINTNGDFWRVFVR